MDLRGGVAGALDGSVDGGSDHSEEFGNFNGRVFPRQMHGEEMFFLLLGELGLLSAQLSLGFGDSRPFTGSCPDQVCLELGNHGQDMEQEFPYGVGGVMDGAADAELDFATGEFINDVLCIAQ